ncbi:MAG: hypothetical protein CM15mV62_840 [uncultured marine virus]|nr:MAG: hypothetical protein CM15mV62_840 [uncultured marine virus]
MIVIEMTEDNEIVRVVAYRPPLGFEKEIRNWRVEYVEGEDE